MSYRRKTINHTQYMKTILPATESLVEKAHLNYETVILKLRQMQDIYLKRNRKLYSNSQVYKIQRSFKAVEHKFFLSSLHLEQLWALSMDSRWELLDAIENSLDKLKWDDTQLVIGSMFLESFLFQARSFLNVYKFYICLVMGIEDPGKMSVERFYTRMRSCKRSSFQKRAIHLLEYFENTVFGPGKWGKLLKELRDKIAHRDYIRPSFDGKETIFEKILLDWPTLQGMTYDQFCQHINNGIFEMLYDTSPILFELEWKSGPFKQTLWKEAE